MAVNGLSEGEVSKHNSTTEQTYTTRYEKIGKSQNDDSLLNYLSPSNCMYIYIYIYI